MASKRLKIALIVGHSADSPGAQGVPPIGKHEYYFNKDFAQALSTKLMEAFEVVIFLRDGKTIATTYQGVAKWAPAASLELHFNASENPIPRGTSTLCSVPNKDFAIAIQNAMLKALMRVGREDRGIEVIHHGDTETRGWENVQILDPEMIPNCLIEPFFGSNVEDCRLILDRMELLCEALLDALLEFFGQGEQGPSLQKS